jgi:hypothetical protein
MIGGVVSVYNLNWWNTIVSGISIEKITPFLDQGGRYFTIEVKASGNVNVEIADIYINQVKIVPYTHFSQELQPNESTNITILYYWVQENAYTVTVTTAQGTQIDSTVQTPSVPLTSSLNILSVKKEVLYPDQPRLKMTVNYNVSTNGFLSAYTGFFLYKAYQNAIVRPIYLFYDQFTMPPDTLQRAEILYNLIWNLGMNITKINWKGLASLVDSKPHNAILILFNPLMNVSGHIFNDAAPACLIDPNEDGYIKAHSAYQKSIVYDWEKDHGLIFISIGSTQAPTTWIIGLNGTAYKPKDEEHSDQFFADTPGAFRGWGPNKIIPTRIGQTLQLRDWISDYYLDTAILNNSIGSHNYYVYGLVKETNWANPCYIRVGEGGWLQCSNGSNLDDTTIAEDLTMIILHAPWNGEWLGPNAWNYDSGANYYLPNGGHLERLDQISTGWMWSVLPSNFSLRTILKVADGESGKQILNQNLKIYEKFWGEEFEIVLENIQTEVQMGGRSINFEVKATGEYSIDVTKVYINKTECLFNSDRNHLEPGTSTTINIHYPWTSNHTYLLRVETKQGSYDEAFFDTPFIKPLMNFTLTDIIPDESHNRTKLTVSYSINITGFSYVNTAFFLHKSYNLTKREIYIFYDQRYIPKATLQQIDTFLSITKDLDLNVKKVTWEALAGLVESKPRAVLILFNPLKTVTGEEYHNSVPSCLLDPGEDGFIRNGSVYNKSLVYDWQKDHGLVFISIGSNQAPSEWIIAQNGTAYEPLDKDLSDKFFIDTQGAFRGMGFNTITPTRIGQSLNLHTWFGSWRLDTSILEETVGADNYYAYGFLANTNLSQPCYVKVDKGGWLHCGEGLTLEEGSIMRDLAMIIRHAPWNGEWLGPNAWNYDSGANYYPINGGIVNIEDEISTGWIPDEAGNSFVLRILSFAYDSEGDYYVIEENVMNYRLES